MNWFKRKPPQPTHRMLKAIAYFRDCQTTGARPDLLGAVYHGGCLGCVYLKGNDTRAGIEWCLQCKYSTFDTSLPDLSQQLARATLNGAPQP